MPGEKRIKLIGKVKVKIWDWDIVSRGDWLLEGRKWNGFTSLDLPQMVNGTYMVNDNKCWNLDDSDLPLAAWVVIVMMRGRWMMGDDCDDERRMDDALMGDGRWMDKSCFLVTNWV